MTPLAKHTKPQETVVGFFTDTTVCIGCKACEVACKQWNQLPDDGFVWTGNSYDNTGDLGASTWRHVAFVEKPVAFAKSGNGHGYEVTIDPMTTAPAVDPMTTAPAVDAMATQSPVDSTGNFSWLMMSDVCKHCERAGCLEACPTGSIVRTEFGTVYVQPDICNGCGYCVVACPFGVIDRREDDGRAWKCTLCYDRLKGDMEPACAKACPTDSIVFGPLDELKLKAQMRVEQLHAQGKTSAYLYGADAAEQPGTEGLHAFFLLVDRPEVYNLPPHPTVPTKTTKSSWASMALAGLGMAALAFGVALTCGKEMSL